MRSSSEVATDRRLLRRAPCELPVILYVGGDICTATAHNICARGIAVTWDRAVDPDTRLTAELFNPSHHFWHRKRVRVVHATPLNDKLWSLGSLFVQEFTAEELRALLTDCQC